jgi:hypothetical protein
MTVFELIDRLNGQILANKARVTVNGVSVIVGRYEGDKMVFTDEGRALADVESNIKAAEAEKPARKAKVAVESTVVFTEGVNVQ